MRGSDAAKKPRLFQFWNSDVAPDEVETLMATWAGDETFDYARYCSDTAAAFIEKHFDGRTLDAYRKCGVPAMQADFFRYCALYICGGIYVDADTRNSFRLPELIEGHEVGTLMMRETRVANDFLHVVRERNRLFERTIEMAVDNIEKEVSSNVWAVTGPGIMTRFHHDAQDADLLKPFDIFPARVVRNHVLFQHDLDYKKGATDWRAAMDSKETSIFLR